MARGLRRGKGASSWQGGFVVARGLRHGKGASSCRGKGASSWQGGFVVARGLRHGKGASSWQGGFVMARGLRHGKGASSWQGGFVMARGLRHGKGASSWQGGFVVARGFVMCVYSNDSKKLHEIPTTSIHFRNPEKVFAFSEHVGVVLVGQLKLMSIKDRNRSWYFQSSEFKTVSFHLTVSHQHLTSRVFPCVPACALLTAEVKVMAMRAAGYF
ncbi:hypothetical protein BgiMline_033170 [Biomphalaria glabrata]|nr:hypothetical protein BgiMline_016146 [Biomphalaria glabrata]